MQAAEAILELNKRMLLFRMAVNSVGAAPYPMEVFKSRERVNYGILKAWIEERDFKHPSVYYQSIVLQYFEVKAGEPDRATDLTSP